VAYSFNPSTPKAEAGRSLMSLRPAWSSKHVPGQRGLLQRNLVSTKQQNKTKQNKQNKKTPNNNTKQRQTTGIVLGKTERGQRGNPL